MKDVEGSSYDFGARIYDPRLGKFLSIDPLTKKYPYLSPYCFAANSPMAAIDQNGEGPIVTITSITPLGKGKIKVSMTVDIEVKVLNVTNKALTGTQIAELESKLNNSAFKSFKSLPSSGVNDIEYLIFNPFGKTKMNLPHSAPYETQYDISFNVNYKFVKSIEEISPSDNVFFIVDNIPKSSTPPDDEVVNPWVDPAGIGELGNGQTRGQFSAIEYSRVMEMLQGQEVRTFNHELGHNLGIPHYSHVTENLMSYKGGTDLVPAQFLIMKGVFKAAGLLDLYQNGQILRQNYGTTTKDQLKEKGNKFLKQIGANESF